MASESKLFSIPEKVPLEAISALAEKLKPLNRLWATMLAKKMYPEKKYDKVREQKIYSIIANNLRDNGRRVQFIILGNELLNEFMEERKKVDQIIEEKNLLAEPVSE